MRLSLQARPSPELLLWLAIAALAVLRFALGADLSVQINYSPHDDSLYVERAFHLLSGEAFGPYDPRILIKYPGLSLWLAGMRTLGIPFLTSINLLYVAAGLYLLSGLRRCGTSRVLVIVAAALYLFNPLSFGYEWIRVIREPLATGLLAAMIGAMLHIHAGVEARRFAWLSLAVFSVVFAFSLFVREDDRLLWGFFALFLAALALQLWGDRLKASRMAAAFLALSILAPIGTAKAYEYGLRAFIERHYGAPILHELGEGEYPRLLAAIRSIDSRKDNRMVMVTQEALAKLRVAVPEFAPVVARLPPPGPGTSSCAIHHVCTEWSNGWMPFWIKDAAFMAGLTPTLIAAQDYFRGVREKIEQACAQGRLSCTPKGSGLVAPMELRWTHAYVEEGLRLAKMTLAPAPHVVGTPPDLYDVPVELGRLFQVVTMTHHFDAERQTSFAHREPGPQYVNPLRELRSRMSAPYQMFAAILMLAALTALLYRLWLANRLPLTPVTAVAAAFGIYSLMRLAALSYVAVFMGAFDPRMVFSTYTLALVLAFPFIAEISRLKKQQPE